MKNHDEKTNHSDEQDVADVTYEEASEDDAVVVDDAEAQVAALQKKLRKLKNELAECKKQAKEHLDGWQRAQADLVNVRRESAEKFTRATHEATKALIKELLPVLDSFAMAFSGEAWEQVDRQWRDGVEYIHQQLISILSAKGLEVIGKEGEPFDPEKHEAIAQEKSTTHKPGTIVRVNQYGYALDGELIRPARVVVAEEAH